MGAAGRDGAALEPLLERGADAIVALGEADPSGSPAAEAGEGFDVIVDYVFGAPFGAALAQGARGAMAVVVGAGAGSEAAVAFGALQGKTIVGHANQTVPLAVRAEAYATMAEHVLAGRLTFAVERYPLERVGEAWEAQAASPHRKLVVVPDAGR
ncbi:MAG TPA: zinc-binding dehydrogenase [Solirubrobacteraceae bacterium]|nr:zinc-binding dehydrogenase [Solirubrobacteraceae bacterium]